MSLYRKYVVRIYRSLVGVSVVKLIFQFSYSHFMILTIVEKDGMMTATVRSVPHCFSQYLQSMGLSFKFIHAFIYLYVRST